LTMRQTIRQQTDSTALFITYRHALKVIKGLYSSANFIRHKKLSARTAITATRTQRKSSTALNRCASRDDERRRWLADDQNAVEESRSPSTAKWDRCQVAINSGVVSAKCELRSHKQWL